MNTVKKEVITEDYSQFCNEEDSKRRGLSCTLCKQPEREQLDAAYRGGDRAITRMSRFLMSRGRRISLAQVQYHFRAGHHMEN